MTPRGNTLSDLFHSARCPYPLCWLFVGMAVLTGQCGSVKAQEEPSIDIQRESLAAESAILRVVDEALIPSQTSGILSSLLVKEGDIVEEGQLLAKVDDVEAEMNYRRSTIEHDLAVQRANSDVAVRAAAKNLTFSREEYQRLKRASEAIPRSISKSELAESRVKAEQAELDLEKAQEELQLAKMTEGLKRTEREIALYNKAIHRIASPIKGMVVEIVRRKGEWVEPGEDVLRIVRIDRLRAEGLVTYRNTIGELNRCDAQIKVSVPGKPEIVVRGPIVFVNPEINPVNGLIRVRAEFDNPEGILMPGMHATMVVVPGEVGGQGPISDAAKPSSPDGA